MSDRGSQVAQIETSKSDASLLRTIKKDDTTYDLYVSKCSCCEEVIYRVMRCNGASFSIYQISRDDCDNLEAYVDELHETLVVDVETKLTILRDCIADRNSKGFFDTEGMSPFRVGLVDKARLIAGRLSKKGLMDEIITKHNDLDHDVASAFILGCIAADLQWLRLHEEAVIEGYAHIEGRESGRPLALAARVRQGKKSRNAVRSAAELLYSGDASLRYNDSKTAQRIAQMKLGSLRKRDGTYLGSEAIVKHLRAIRHHEQTKGKSL